MILTELANYTAYRMHTPKWASRPLSGAGAAKHGGRLNRPGHDALYLSLEQATAIQEYQQLSDLLPPGLLVSYQLTVVDVVDFRQGSQNGLWPPLWDNLFCDWRDFWFNRHLEPPSWLIADAVIAAGYKGILFKSSLYPSGTNLVLYPRNLMAADTVTVYDPNHSLPKNQDSWL